MSACHPADAHLWEAYRADPSNTGARNAIFEHHWPWISQALARYLAKHNRERLYEESLSFLAEYVLTQAIPAFEQQAPQGKQFAQRVEWAVLEAIRSLDPLSRLDRQRSAIIHRGREELGHRLGHHPTDAELAEYLGIAEEELLETCREIQAEASAVYRPPPGDEGFEELIRCLPDHYKEAVRRCYQDGYTEREIASQLGITHQAVNDFLKRAKRKLRKRLAKSAMKNRCVREDGSENAET
jgi:RNA polymerase sigma factor (sigma-70 family)